MQNININNTRALSMKLLNDEYLDFMLYKGEVVDGALYDYDACLVADIDIDSIGPDNKLYSHSTWDGAINKGVELNDIGFTGVDNGFISYDKDRITNKEFLKIYTGSTYTITEDDKRLFLSPITGNTETHTYEKAVIDDYFVLKGGFYQGFYKLEGFDYQTLPNKVENEWCLCFKLRPRDYEIKADTLNSTHTDTDGIFFYMGLRAENKFLKYYKIAEELKKRYQSNEYFSDEPCGEETPENVYYNGDSEPHVVNCDYIPEECACSDEPIDWDGEVPAFEEEYVERDTKITSNEFKTKDGVSSSEEGHYEIKTDNKFILFDRTENGYTVDTWNEEITAILTGVKKPNINLFPLMNRTETGYTVNTIAELYREYAKEFDPIKDTKGNCFALRIKKDGSIGYRMGILDCDAEDHYKVFEEYSDPLMVKEDEWTTVCVRIRATTPTDKCSKFVSNLKLYFYVNERLVFISKEIPSFVFKALNETYQKQEGVPFNISLGGGTQGLMEVIYPDYYERNKEVWPLERDFAGTFIGDIKWFKFYNCPMNYSLINQMSQL